MKQIEIDSLVQTIQERTLGNILNVVDLIDIPLTGHVFIAGQNRSGKTTLAKVLFSVLVGHRIFYNIQNDREIYGLSDVTVFSPRELFEAIGLGKQRINYIPPSNSEESRAHLLQIYQMLMALGSYVAKLPQVSSVKKYFWCTLFVDEAHIVAPKRSKDDGVSLLTTRGAGLGIRVVTISQRPALLSQTILTQSPFYFIFYVSPMERKYFSSYGLNLNEYKVFLDYQKHRYIFWDGFRTIPCEALRI